MFVYIMKLVECIVLMEIPIQNSYGKVPTSLPNSSTAWIYVYCFFSILTFYLALTSYGPNPKMAHIKKQVLLIM